MTKERIGINHFVEIILLFFLGSSLSSFFILVGSRSLKKQSIVRPKSYCVNCKTSLNVFELIPVLSWFLLRGKCRSCQAKIPASYVVLELLPGIILVCGYYFLDPHYLVLGIMLLIYLLVILIVRQIEKTSQEEV